jgi:hypothetical protein
VGRPPRRATRALLAACALACGAGALAQERRHVELPSQPLDAALVAFGDAMGVQILYDAAITRGRRSAAIAGDYAPEDGLRALLAPTDLVARATAPNAFTLGRSMPAPAPPAPAPAAAPVAEAPDAPLPEAFAPYAGYFGAVQRRVRAALCAVPGLRPGDYAVDLRLAFEPGAAPRTTVVASSGDAARDRALEATLAATALPAPPPGAPRAFILSLVPRPPGEGGECDPVPLRQ